MSGRKAPHHMGSYHRRSLALVAAARADSGTRCWRCHRTIAEVRTQEHKPRADWTAGHLVDGQPDGHMLPECSPCNYGAGARLMHARKARTSAAW